MASGWRAESSYSIEEGFAAMMHQDAPFHAAAGGPTSSTRLSLAALALGSFAAMALWFADPPVVHALGTADTDSDADGLSDHLEQAIGTDPYIGDSDLDGFGDSEEYARHSSPVKHWETPRDEDVSLGMGATSESNGLHAITTMYVKDGTLTGKTITFGVMVAGKMTTLPTGYWTANSTLTTVPAAVPGELVAVLDVKLNPALLRRTGSGSIWTILSGPGVIAADALNLTEHSGIVLQRLNLVTQPGGSPGTQMVVPQANGAVFRPLGGTAPPPSWSAGAICNQTTDVVGYSGATVTEEVTSAACETGWDSYCDTANCSASVGTTIQTIDPAVLAGG